MRKIGFSIKENNPSIVSDIDKAITSGFRHIEIKLLSQEDKKKLTKNLIDKITSHNPKISFSIHSPLQNVNIGALDEKIRVSSVEKIKSSIIIANEIGAEFVVFHGGKIPQGNSRAEFFVEKAIKAQIHSIDEILDFGKDCSVKCAVENGYTLKDLGLVVNFNDFKFLAQNFSNLSFLVDIGHFRINSSLKEMVLALDRKINHQIIAIHLHDNHKKKDDHLSLGEGSLLDEKNELKIILEKLHEKTVILENLCLKDAVKSKNRLLAYKLVKVEGKKFKKTNCHK
ncbi:MAG: sugar phosphate isomerase/epimerase family protein [Candidatus Hodarchaeales archaeon]